MLLIAHFPEILPVLGKQAVETKANASRWEKTNKYGSSTPVRMRNGTSCGIPARVTCATEYYQVTNPSFHMYTRKHENEEEKQWHRDGKRNKTARKK